jgi:DnaJ-class molecular chaperone
MRSHLLSDGKRYWECSECQHESEDTTEYEEAVKLCHACSGSGEGYSDGSWCSRCQGLGVLGDVEIEEREFDKYTTIYGE